MKILHVIDQFSQTIGGGSARVPYYLSREQASLGHEVTVYASDWNTDGQNPPSGVNVKLFKLTACPLGLRFSAGMLWADYKNYDIVHLHNYRTIPNIIAANRGVPCILQSHGSTPLGRWRHYMFESINNFFWRNAIFKRACRYICVSPMEKEQYVKEGAKPDDVVVIPSGIDYEEYKVLPPRQPCGKKRILFLGRIHRIKGIKLLIYAFAHLDRDDAVLQIAGPDDGWERDLREYANLAGIEDNVEWLGPLYGRDKIQAYVNADVYVLPSLYEIFGLTVLEALACGTPVILSSRCGLSPMLGNMVRLEVPPIAERIADAINCVLDSPDGKDELAEWRINKARQFSWEKVAEQTLRLYEEVLNE